MKVKVDKEKCIGCGACAAMGEEIFELNDEGMAEAKKEEVSEEEKETVIAAKEACPTDAIVTEE